MTPIDQALESAITHLLSQRAEGKTICPSEAARFLSPTNWKPLMPQAQAAARRLANQGKLVITQHGKPVNPSQSKGPIRLRRP